MMTPCKNVHWDAFLRLTLVIMIFFAAGESLFAQKNRKVVVYLKSGEVVFGRILSQDSAGIRQISNDCGIRLLSPGEIDHIGRGGFARPGMKKSGYYNQSTAALLFGEGQEGFQPKPSLTMVNGWQWGQRVFTGMGIGYEYFNRGVLPLFAESKFMIGTESVSPFLSFRIGYSFPVGKHTSTDYYTSVSETFGGIHLNPEAGIRIAAGASNSLILSIGYHYQELSHNEDSFNGWDDYTKKVITNYNRISVKLGFIFQ